MFGNQLDSAIFFAKQLDTKLDNVNRKYFRRVGYTLWKTWSMSTPVDMRFVVRMYMSNPKADIDQFFFVYLW